MCSKVMPGSDLRHALVWSRRRPQLARRSIGQILDAQIAGAYAGYLRAPISRAHRDLCAKPTWLEYNVDLTRVHFIASAPLKIAEVNSEHVGRLRGMVGEKAYTSNVGCLAGWADTRVEHGLPLLDVLRGAGTWLEEGPRQCLHDLWATQSAFGA